MNNDLRKVVFYVPVQEKYLPRWEYYRVDQRIIEPIFDEVIVASNFADNETKNEMYQEADLYFQPSTYEGFGNSVLEAMSYGTPAIVSGLTAQPEVVKDSGYVLREISEDWIYKVILENHTLTAAER